MAVLANLSINNAAAVAVSYTALGASGDASKQQYQAEWADKSPGIFERWRRILLGVKYPMVKGQMIRVRTKFTRPGVDANGNVITVLLHEGVTYIHPSSPSAERADFVAQIVNGYNHVTVKEALTDGIIPS